MKKLGATLLCSALVALAACDPEPGSHGPDLGDLETALAPQATVLTCYQYASPIFRRQRDYDPDVMTASCRLHACGGLGTLDAIVQDGHSSIPKVDLAIFTCPDLTKDTVLSNDDCWDCIGDCGDPCPEDGCVVEIATGSDCRAYDCPAGYDLIPNYPYAPTCRRPCPPPVDVTIRGPTTIRPGATCTWEAVASGGTSPYSYYWTGEIQPYGTTGRYYTGGKDSGVLGSQFTIRVDVSDAGTGSDWSELTVTENPNAMACFQ
ncbi:MAG: hypothetical protein OEZ54_09525 [Gemmatimonadota bacterium]|nr:hypothetical protein [Gemmatimonadota bacterium]